VKEYQIVEAFLGAALKDEVMKIMPVQKQTRAGQRTRFKARLSLPSARLWVAVASVSAVLDVCSAVLDVCSAVLNVCSAVLDVCSAVLEVCTYVRCAHKLF
jgi:hypothetical protein